MNRKEEENLVNFSKLFVYFAEEEYPTKRRRRKGCSKRKVSNKIEKGKKKKRSRKEASASKDEAKKKENSLSKEERRSEIKYVR